MKRKHRESLKEMRDIVHDMETCMRVLDTYARSQLGRFADIPMKDWPSPPKPKPKRKRK